MKSFRNVLTAMLLTAGAALTAAAGAPDAPSGFQGWRHHGGVLHMLSRLNLSDAQKQQVRDIVAAARPQLESLREQMHANRLQLKQTQPNDPNYASVALQASQTQGSLSAQMTAQQAELRAQVFKVLTPAQQTQLAALEPEKRR